MATLGIDPSMTATGLAIIYDGIPDAVATVRLASVKADDKGEQLVRRIAKLFEAIDEIIGNYPIDLIAVERTDWMRNLQGNPEWKKQYAIERRNQEALALLQGALATYACLGNLPFMLLGVNEWHTEFGAGNKDKVAELLAQEFPNQIERVGGLTYWKDNGEQKLMDNNQTDAVALALVAYKRHVRNVMETGEQK